MTEKENEQLKPKEAKLKRQSTESKRRQALKKKGSASASDNFKDFLKGDKKEQDPEKKAQANKLLRKIMCDQWWILVLALPLSFLGAM